MNGYILLTCGHWTHSDDQVFVTVDAAHPYWCYSCELYRARSDADKPRPTLTIDDL